MPTTTPSHGFTTTPVPIAAVIALAFCAPDSVAADAMAEAKDSHSVAVIPICERRAWYGNCRTVGRVERMRNLSLDASTAEGNELVMRPSAVVLLIINISLGDDASSVPYVPVGNIP